MADEEGAVNPEAKKESLTKTLPSWYKFLARWVLWVMLAKGTLWTFSGKDDWNYIFWGTVGYLLLYFWRKWRRLEPEEATLTEAAYFVYAVGIGLIIGLLVKLIVWLVGGK